MPDADAVLGCDRAAVLVASAEAAYLCDDVRTAIDLLGEALTVVAAATDPARHGIMLERLGRCLWSAGRGDESLVTYEQAVLLVPDRPTPERARVLAGLAHIYSLSGRTQSGGDTARRALELARQVGDRQLEGHVLDTLAVTEAHLDETEAALAHITAALAIAEELRDPDGLCRGWVNRVFILWNARRVEECLEVSRLAIGTMNRLGLTSTASYIASLAAEAATHAGRWDQARSLVQDALADAVPGVSLISAEAGAAVLYAITGDIGEARLHEARGKAALGPATDLRFRTTLLEAGVEIALRARCRRRVGSSVPRRCLP